MRRNYANKKVLALLLTLLLTLSLSGCDVTNQDSLLPNGGGDKNWENLQDEINQAVDGDTVDLTSYVWQIGDCPAIEIIVPEGLSFTLRGRQMYDIRNISFLFMGNNSIVIEDLVLTSWLDESELDRPPHSVLHFLKGDNHLELVGNSVISMISHMEKLGYGAAIGVPEGTSLTIEGSGNLTVNGGGGGGAGIGGGYKSSSGNITISSGNLVVYGGVAYAYQTSPAQQKGAAAIGGGYGADGGVTVINGGKIAAMGGLGGAGIGGGHSGAGGTVTFTGGFVEAYSDEGGAGIGGGYGGAGGSITIVAGKVEAYSNQTETVPAFYEEIPGPGPAIGDGYGGTGGTLAMSGGSLAALGYGRPSHPAISCTIQALPNNYSWSAGVLEELGTKSDMAFDSTELSFSNTSNYSYVRIESTTTVVERPATDN
jgi:hypothetical protein